MKNLSLKDLALFAIVAAMYATLTVLTSSISYEGIQFRISEVLVLLCFFNKKYYLPLVLGCFIANLFSPYGMMDVIFGTLATAIALIGVCRSKNIIVASLFPVIVNALVVGFEIAVMNGQYQFDISVFEFSMFTLFALQVGFGEFVCVTILGVLVFSALRKNVAFMELIEANQNI